MSTRRPGITQSLTEAARFALLVTALGLAAWGLLFGAAWALGTWDYHRQGPLVPVEETPVLRAPTFEPEHMVLMEYQNGLQRREDRVSRLSATLGGSRYLSEVVEAHSAVNGLDPQIVAGVILTENPWLKPDTVNSYGAVGLMQVVGWLHQGAYPECGPDLTDIQTNVCYGTSLLAVMLDRSEGDLDEALLRYNGCRGSTYIPGCERYTTTVYTRGGLI